MIWQDLAITSTNIIFTLALIPQIYYGFKEKKGLVSFGASAPTFICLFVLAYTYSSLNLKFATLMTVLTGLAWLTLFLQRWKYGPTSNCEA